MKLELTQFFSSAWLTIANATARDDLLDQDWIHALLKDTNHSSTVIICTDSILPAGADRPWISAQKKLENSLCCPVFGDHLCPYFSDKSPPVKNFFDHLCNEHLDCNHMLKS